MKENKRVFLQGIVIGVLSCILVLLSYNIFQNYTVLGDLGATTINTRSVKRKLSQVDCLIQGNYLNEVDRQLVEDRLFEGIAKGLEDTYSVYYTPKEYKAITEETEGQYSGIGVVMQQNEDTKEYFIAKVYNNSPADKAGILPMDIIKKVNDQEVSKLTLNELGNLIREGKTETIKMSIYRPSQEKSIDFSIKKEKVEIQMVDSKMLENKVGYISVAEFTKVSGSQVKSAYEELQKQGMEKLIIDLRNNPGGLLSSVKEISDLFLKKDQLIVYTEDKQKRRLEYRSEDDEQIQLPMVLLVNAHSASASEIFAGVVKDYNLGTIVGTTTFGKGIVQKIFPLQDDSALKLTISHYYTPKGNDIHKKGITPDVEIEMDAKDLVSIGNLEKDTQLKKALELLEKE